MARSRSGRPGPSPFSSEYREIAPPPPRRRLELPGWIPSASILIALLLLVVSLGIAVTGGPSTPGSNTNLTAPEVAAGAETPTTAPVVPSPTPTEEPTPRPTAPPEEPTPTPLSGLAITPVVTQAAATSSDPDAILPRYRILSYYGHPHNDTMGILGEHSMEELLELLQEEQAAYEAADPAKPVMPAFELIVSVAQNWPADDDTYLLHTDAETIQEYVDFTAENGILLILDIQIGHSTVRAEIDKIEQWLLYPHVHLAIDPEFAMDEGEIPGTSIGGIDASDITYAQERMAKLALDNDLPPKVLIVHQFYEGMIRNSETLAPVEGVQLVIEFDGFGDPANKTAGYTQFIHDRPIEFGGIKLFYQQDDPLMTPAEITGLAPPPDLVIYQ